MASKTDRSGIITVYTYDIFGRKLSENAGGEIQNYTYDNNGNLLTMTDSTGTTQRTYDGLNRTISKTVPGIGKSIYNYDLVTETGDGTYSERTTDPKGNVTVKTYDKAGRLSKVTADGETTVYSYLANGTRSKVTYPDGTTETYTYNKSSQVTVLINSRADGSEISYYRYTYDKAGNQLTKTEAKGTTVYTYDSLNRLGSVTEPGGRVTSYSYDKAGNRRTESMQNGALYSNTLYTYDNQNRLLSTVSTGGAFTRYYYDSNGNLINKITGIMKDITDPSNLTAEDLTHFGLVIKRESDYGTGSGDITSYTYDPYNRLTGYKAENTSAAYQYNAQGYRVEKTVNGETTKYLYEADKVVLETDADNRQTAFQVYGTNLLYRSVASDADTDAQSYYYLYNAHGDVTELIDADGNIAVAYDYDAFGNLLGQAGEADNPARYAGYQYDDESGLYYLNARYYDSVTARFISEDDPKYSKSNDLLSLNLYTYCANNPIRYDDPSGHNTLEILKELLNRDKGSLPNSNAKLQKSDIPYKVVSDLINKVGNLMERSTDDNKTSSKPSVIENYISGSSTISKLENWRSDNKIELCEAVIRHKSTIDPFDKSRSEIIIDGSEYKDETSSKIREWIFTFKHPFAAIDIGTVAHGSNNISTVAVRFATNDLGLIENEEHEGSQVNAFRHALWQSMITAEYGVSIATQAGNCHEEHPDALDYIAGYAGALYTDLSLADEACDLLNNQIGREIGKQYNNATPANEVALATLEYYHDYGLWVAVEQPGGLYEIKQQQLTDKEYEEAYNRLDTLDEYGYGPDNEKPREGNGYGYK